MEWRELIVDAFERILELLEPALEGMTPQDLNRQPHPDCNSMGWITWHLTRIEDSGIAEMSGEEQLWLKDKWYEKFGRPPDPSDDGYGETSEQVAAFRSPEADVFLNYHRAVLEQTRRYIRKLKRADLDRRLYEPQPLPYVGGRLISLLADCLEHAGEVAYVRGLLKGKGWME